MVCSKSIPSKIRLQGGRPQVCFPESALGRKPTSIGDRDMAGSGDDERIREIILDRVPFDGSVTDDDSFFESLAADAEGSTADDCRRVRDLMLADGTLVRPEGGGFQS